MPITDILEYNAEHYGDDVCLVDINPKIQEKRKVLWKDYNLIESTGDLQYRREITWRVFDEKANRFAQFLQSRGVRKGHKVAI